MPAFPVVQFLAGYCMRAEASVALLPQFVEALNIIIFLCTLPCRVWFVCVSWFSRSTSSFVESSAHHHRSFVHFLAGYCMRAEAGLAVAPQVL